MSFKHLGLSKASLRAIEDLGFSKATEIQTSAIPILIQGQDDFIGLAQTGTGKTAAFGLPLLELLDPSNRSVQALILTPTRELCQQVAQQIYLFTKYRKDLRSTAVFGGASIIGQIKDLKKNPQIVIATPGRLIDLLKRRAVFLDQLEILILDEADEMLNMGFKEELDDILQHAPQDSLKWLFSATMPKEIRRIVDQYMSSPKELRVNTKNEVNANISHQFTVVKQSNKKEALVRMLDHYPTMKGLVFCRTRRDTQELADNLQKLNYRADALHGDLSQRARDQVMKRFRENQLQVLVATDVAARGIDVQDLSHVVHYALPDELQYYTHRSGRTARAGKTGISLALINTRELSKLERIARDLKISFEKVRVPSISDIADSRIEHWCLKMLDTKTKGKIDDELLEKVKIMFSALSKDELISKFLASELELLNLGDQEDINQNSRPYNRSDKKTKKTKRRSDFEGRSGNRKKRPDRKGRASRARRKKNRSDRRRSK